MPPSQLFPGAISWRGIKTENFVIRGSGVTLKDTNSPFWISVNLSVSDTFKSCMKQDKWSFCVTISRREKGGAQPILSCVYLMVYLIMVDMSFSWNTDVFVFVFFCKTQVLDPTSRDLWCYQHCHISCCNHWKIRENRFLNPVSRFTL